MAKEGRSSPHPTPPLQVLEGHLEKKEEEDLEEVVEESSDEELLQMIIKACQDSESSVKPDAPNNQTMDQNLT